MPKILGNMSVGSIVKIKENGIPVDFYVAKHDYESELNGAGKTLLVRKNALTTTSAWSQDGQSKGFTSSDIYNYLHNTYYPTIDIYSAIPWIRIYCSTGNYTTTVTTMSAYVFILSCAELAAQYYNPSHSGRLNVEGTPLPIASNIIGCYKDGDNTVEIEYWTRSPDTAYDEFNAWSIMSAVPGVRWNKCRLSNMINSYGIRPCFVLDASMYISDSNVVVSGSPPTAPTSINIPSSIKGGDTITVSWGASTDVDGNLAGYKLERNINNSGWSQIYQGSSTSTTNLVEFGTNTVQYRVKAYDSEGLESEYTTSSIVSVINNTAPSTPASITIPNTSQVGKQITISWSASTDAENNLSGYTLQRFTNNAWVQVYQGNALSYQDTIPSSTTDIKYRVQAYDTEGLTSDWKESSVIRLVTDPSNIVISPNLLITGQSLAVTWESSESDANYILERNVNNTSYEQVYSGTEKTFTETILEAWTSVQYRVKSIISGYETGYATSNSFQVFVPVVITISETFNKRLPINITWESNTHTVDKYILERSINNGEYSQIYEGLDTNFTDTSDIDWDTIQYRIKFIIGIDSSPWYVSIVSESYDIITQRVHRKDSTGYNTIHFVTSADMVIMSDGKTAEEAINTMEKPGTIEYMNYNTGG